jgi:hypothetical protein
MRRAVAGESLESGVRMAYAAMLLARDRDDFGPLCDYVNGLSWGEAVRCCSALAQMTARYCDWPEDLVRGFLLKDALEAAS